MAESNGSLLPGLWRDSLHVTCGLTACTPGSAPGPTVGNEYGKTSPLPFIYIQGERLGGLKVKVETNGRTDTTEFIAYLAKAVGDYTLK